jgi:general secretion pathway protein D
LNGSIDSRRRSPGARAARARRAALALPLALAALAGAGCTTYRELRRAEQAEAREEWDAAVEHYIQLAERDPGNLRWRSALLRARLRAAHEHAAAGRRFQEAGVLERAALEYQRAVALDPTNQSAAVELEKIRARLAEAAAPEPTLDELKRKHQDAAPQPPLLNPRSKSPISIDFPEPASLFQIYQSLGKAFGINILFDPQLRDSEMAIELRDVTAQTALETLMRAAGHFYKVIDEQTILIAQDNQQNRRAYEDLVIQTFYLSNAEAKEAVQLVRSLVNTRNLSSSETLNSITVRDTADKVRIIQKIIETLDKARAEVVIDIELIEVDSSRLRDLGVSLSAYQVTQKIDLGEDAPIRLSDLEHLTQASWVLTIPTIIYDFVKTNTDAHLLAKPQVRITEGEKAKVRIGDQVPIPVTTFNTSQTVGGNIVPVTSFQYKDVGINIDLEPRVHHNREVTLKLQIEVSQVTGTVTAGGGQAQPIIGQRTIESTIRLKDGETNFLAGLIREDESTSETGIPGLSDIPILGKLFSKNRSDAKRTDVMLTLTPRIIRAADITESDILPIWVGTEANMTFRGGSPRVESPEEGPFEVEEPEPEPEPVPEEKPEPEPGEDRPAEPPAGIQLAPAGAPSSPFQPPPREPPAEPIVEPPAGAAALAPDRRLDLVPSSRGFLGAGDGGVRLALEPSVVSVAPGDRFELAVAVDSRVPVAHLPSTLEFDPALLAVEAVEGGDFLGGAGAAEVVADTSTAGTVVLGASRRGQKAGVAGRGRIARVTFRALAPGAGSVRFAAQRVLDPALVEIGGVVTGSAAIEVRPREVAPPPANGAGR